MKEYLGESIVEVSKTEYTMFNKNDWALLWIEMYRDIDGSHHKDWLTDQIARILKGTKVIVKLAKWSDGTKEFRFSLDTPSSEYLKWVDYMKSGEDGANTYDYDFGVAP